MSVYRSCWEKDPEIDAWNAANGHDPTDFGYIVSYFYMQMIASMQKVSCRSD